jgi:hypothetical protein
LFTANSEALIRLIGNGLYCFLLQQFGHARTAIQLLARGLVQIGCELRERGQFAVLSQVGTDTAGQAFDQLWSGRRHRRATPRYRR